MNSTQREEQISFKLQKHSHNNRSRATVIVTTQASIETVFWTIPSTATRMKHVCFACSYLQRQSDTFTYRRTETVKEPHAWHY